MAWSKVLSIVCFVGLTGCDSGPVSTALLSETPADAKSFAVAQQAVKACYGANALDKFRRAGFGVAKQPFQLRNGRQAERVVISPPNDAVSVLYLQNSCFVGLKNMTPSQSAELAQIWVRAFDAKPNSAFGDGLSRHVSGAWRNLFTEPARLPGKAEYKHRIYIKAYKTWPQGPNDPQRDVPYSIDGLFPNSPGAAVAYTHTTECKSHIKTGPRSGAFLPCSGPSYKPR